MRAGCLVGRRLEVDISESAPATPSDRDFLVGGNQIGDERPGRVVDHGSAGRHGQDEVVAGLAMTARAGAAAAGGRSKVMGVAEVAQRRLPGIDAEGQRAAASAVAAVRAAARNVGLTPERRRAVAAVTGPDPDLDPV